jgi:hypothetical protein
MTGDLLVSCIFTFLVNYNNKRSRELAYFYIIVIKYKNIVQKILIFGIIM